MRMRSLMLAAPLLLATLPAGTAAAWPNLATASPELASPELLWVHHKPWHQGGPPWLRRKHPGKIQAWERRRYEESRRWRGEQRVPDWTDLPRARDTFRFGD